MNDIEKKILMLTKIREFEVRKRTDDSLKRSDITLGGYVKGLGFSYGEVEGLCDEMQNSGWVQLGSKTLGGSRGSSKRTVKLTATGREYLESAIAGDENIAEPKTKLSSEQILSALVSLTSSDGKLEIQQGNKIADQLESSDYYVRTETGYSELKIHESVLNQLVKDCHLVRESGDIYTFTLKPNKDKAIIEPKPPKGIEQIQWWLSESRKHPKQALLYVAIAIGSALGIKQFVLPSLFGTQESEIAARTELSVVVLNYSENMNVSETVMVGLQKSIVREFGAQNVQLEKKVGDKAGYDHTGKYYYESDEKIYRQLKTFIRENLKISGCVVEILDDLKLDPVKYSAPLGKVEYWINSVCAKN